MSRSCGPCFACCIAIGVRQLDKKPGRWCPLIAAPTQRAQGACSVYDGRPEECRKFECLWLTETIGLLKDEERPDRLGAVPWVSSEAAEAAGGNLPTITFYATSNVPENTRLRKVRERMQREGITTVFQHP